LIARRPPRPPLFPSTTLFRSRMFRCGDSVYTYDIAEGHRMSVFTLAGQYVRVFRFTPPAGEATPYASACNRNGDFVHLGWEKQGDRKSTRLNSSHLVISYAVF